MNHVLNVHKKENVLHFRQMVEFNVVILIMKKIMDVMDKL